MSDTWYDPLNPQPEPQPLWMTVLLALGGIVGTLFIVPFLFMVAMFALVWLMTWPGPDKDFDASEWREGNGQQRWRMHDDLLENKILEGKTWPEVVELLGCKSPPDHCGANSITYYMGRQHNSVFPVDSDWLLVEFRPDGTFARARVVND